jgi:chaperonin GroEL
VAAVVKDIERHASKVQCSPQIAQVGTISANGDKAIGKVIADATKKVGNEGVITVKEPKTAETELSTSSRGSSPTGPTSRPISSPAARRWWPKAAHILIHEKKLSSLQPLVPILESIVQAGKPLLMSPKTSRARPGDTIIEDSPRG